MRYGSLMLALGLVLVVVACQCQDDDRSTFTAADEDAIRGMLDEYVADVVAEDWTANVGYYTADAVRMPPNAPVLQGHEAIRAWMDALPPVTGFTLSPQVVAGAGDMAHARGGFTLDLAPPDAEPVNMVGKWQAVYERQADGSWLCVSDIWNSDAPMAM